MKREYTPLPLSTTGGADAGFKVFHELMDNRIREILLVLSPFDAFIMEEDGSLATRIISEYSGLNLSHPPRMTQVSSGKKALALLKNRPFDMVITMPQLSDMDAFSLGLLIKEIQADLPVILLARDLKGVWPVPPNVDRSGIDRFFVWSAGTDLLLALVKNAEDHLNAEHDTRKAMVRVLVLIEDSPYYLSSFLPLIYQEVVSQTQAVLDESLNEEHRLLKMRARPKILVAENHEMAMDLIERFRPYLFGIISDTRFPKKGVPDNRAGSSLLSRIRNEVPDLPLLLLSSNPDNRKIAEQIPAVFLDKNSPRLLDEIHNFFLTHLGFGDFIFRLPDGREVGRASTLHGFEKALADVPEASLLYHAKRNHFSNWIMARSEVALASRLSRLKISDFENVSEIRNLLITSIHGLRKTRQQGVVVKFDPEEFDSDAMDFVKIGNGSLGGKALGLAFMASRLSSDAELGKTLAATGIKIPKTLVITTDGFDSFVRQNNLQDQADGSDDEVIAQNFLNAHMPVWLYKELEAYLKQIAFPLTVRSSSILEDALFKPYAGLFETYMIPNNHPDFAVRLSHLFSAIKLVFASTYFAGPRAFSKSAYQAREESMGVIVQQLVGETYGNYFYPAISGVAQSHNYYPISFMKPDEGIAHIALGFGKTVVEGGKSLRFSPRYPKKLPQFSTVDDILANCQRKFYALKMRGYAASLLFNRESNLEIRDLSDAFTDLPVKTLCSAYIPEENRIRNGAHKGPLILTFSQVLKHNQFPLPALLSELLDFGRTSMGCSVEIEFAVNMGASGNMGTAMEESNFYFLQIRPMVAGQERFDVQISQDERAQAFCSSSQALGHGLNEEITDIIFVKPSDFDPAATQAIAREIGTLNTGLVNEQRPYLLIGPGRWGSADRWLGIPVRWQDISGVGAMIELRNDTLMADPSQGTHFFQNITSLGIHYVTITEGTDDVIDWEWLLAQPVLQETTYLCHARLEKPFTLKVNSRESECVMIQGTGDRGQG
ncbi:MAG: phosphoenolpyruvate synthase/pyruvate phosphate dikinase, partial [Desulfobulbaceae bacterium]|nr:phosphoenolpyruvate synthase/pyruvate phosphate dikinase [Desulfobulbaceae bacterium]